MHQTAVSTSLQPGEKDDHQNAVWSFQQHLPRSQSISCLRFVHIRRDWETHTHSPDNYNEFSGKLTNLIYKKSDTCSSKTRIHVVQKEYYSSFKCASKFKEFNSRFNHELNKTMPLIFKEFENRVSEFIFRFLAIADYADFCTGGQIKEFTDEESNFTALLQKAMDMEGVDRDTVYQLVALLMRVRNRVKRGQREGS